MPIVEKVVLNPDPYKGRSLLVPPGTDITKYRKAPLLADAQSLRQQSGPVKQLGQGEEATEPDTPKDRGR